MPIGLMCPANQSISQNWSNSVHVGYNGLLVQKGISLLMTELPETATLKSKEVNCEAAVRRLCVGSVVWDLQPIWKRKTLGSD